MIWLVLNIIVSGLLFVIFRYFPKYNIDNLVAVIVNYITATVLGCILMGSGGESVFTQHWFPVAFSLGVVFIFIFLLMAASAQVNGIAMTSVANKMSLVIPVVAGVFLYSEDLTGLKILGILLALVSVVLTTLKDKDSVITRNGYFLLIILFVGSGVIDSMMKYMQHYHLKENESAAFVMVIFMAAALFGFAWILVMQRDRIRNFNKVSVIGGIVLGIPNFCSIYFLILALEKSGLQSSVLYPINNMGVVGFSALLGLILFREKLSLINLTGILIALGAIALIAFG